MRDSNKDKLAEEVRRSWPVYPSEGSFSWKRSEKMAEEILAEMRESGGKRS